MKLGLVVVAAAVLAGAAAGARSPVADGRGVVVAHGGSIYVEGVRVARGAQPAWSPDGSALAYVRAGQVFVARRDGTRERRLTVRRPGLHWPASFPAWSADGTRIAFSGTRDLFAVRVADGRLTALTRSGESWRGNFTPAYSPDGRTLAFSRSTDAFNNDIFLARPDGSGLRRLTRSLGTHDRQGEEMMPAWSPDGRTLVFVSNRDGNFELYAIDRTGRNERRLTRTPGVDEENPRFGSDGRRILFVHDGRVATMNADGTGVRELGLGTAADWR